MGNLPEVGGGRKLRLLDRVAATMRDLHYSKNAEGVMEIELPGIDALRAKKPERLAVVLSVEKVRGGGDGLDGIELSRGGVEGRVTRLPGLGDGRERAQRTQKGGGGYERGGGGGCRGWVRGCVR